jgi:hypothetical protein
MIHSVFKNSRFQSAKSHESQLQIKPNTVEFFYSFDGIASSPRIKQEKTSASISYFDLILLYL